MKIDAHQHFWTISNRFTDWPTPDCGAIYKDYAAADLYPHLSENGIDGTILVQAAPSVSETRFLLGIADRAPFVKGVIGWIDFTDPRAARTLAAFASHPAFRGVRPMLQNIEERDWILRGKFTPVFAAIIDLGLCFDALIMADQIAAITALAHRHPALRLVVNHGAKPPIASGAFDSWAQDMRELAAAPNVHCKLSGLWAEAGGDTSHAAIAPYAMHLLEIFGPARLMWGSGWPVVERAGSYGAWLAQCEHLLAATAPADRAQIFGGTAARFYGLHRD